jgi:hypothetical protein
MEKLQDDKIKTKSLIYRQNIKEPEINFNMIFAKFKQHEVEKIFND